MQINIITAFLNAGDVRVNFAQSLFLSSISRFPEIRPIIIPGHPRPRFNEMLATARLGGVGDYFGWINSDCQLLLSPRVIIFENQELDVIGLRRIEIATGEKCGGVDGYLVKKDFYDKHLANGPSLWVGATHIDWWVTRAAQKAGKYGEGFFLAHIPHEKTNASAGIDEIGQENIRAYNDWADKNGISKC
jgi:hypothetical protein